MNVPCTRVSIGDYAYTVVNKEKGERGRWTYSTVAALTKSSLDITLEYVKVVENEDEPDINYVSNAKIQSSYCIVQFLKYTWQKVAKSGKKCPISLYLQRVYMT